MLSIDPPPIVPVRGGVIPDSLNGFLASTEGSEIAPKGMNYLSLEPYDVYWGRVRDMYAPFENGMKSGTARVFDHQIPGKISRKLGVGS